MYAKKLTDMHHEIIRLTALGFKSIDVARMVGVTDRTVRNVLNSPLGEQKLAVLRAARDAETTDIGRRIQKLAPLAVERIQEVLERGFDEHDEKTVVKVATDVLDRAGHGAVKKFQGLVGVLSAEEIQRIKQESEKIRKQANIVVQE